MFVGTEAETRVHSCVFVKANVGDLLVGTEAETKEFVAVCVRAVDKFAQSDVVSPVFIFERLCNIIIPVIFYFLFL